MTAGKLWTVEVTDTGGGVLRLDSALYEDVNYNAVAPHNASHVVQVRQNLIKDMKPFTTSNTAVKASYKVEKFLIAGDLAAHVAKSLTTLTSDAGTDIGAAGYTVSAA